MSEIKKIRCQDGEVFTIAGLEFIKFPDQNGKTPVVMKDIAFRSRFGNDNNLHTSEVLKRLQMEVLPRIIEAVGEENVLEFETDLTTLDGLTPYEPVKSRISLPTMDFYRANANIFGRFKPDHWWWLATPESAQPNSDPDWVVCVSPSGVLFSDHYDNIVNGVRPFCIFNSSIFES